MLEEENKTMVILLNFSNAVLAVLSCSCKRNHVKTWINGQKVSDVKGIKKHHGRFGIQHHGSGGTVKFRSLRFRPLDL